MKVTVVTWHPDCYKYGKSEVRMELLEQLRGTGFEIQLMEDNLMRVVSGDIAAEIMEMTFGGEKELMNW